MPQLNEYVPGKSILQYIDDNRDRYRPDSPDVSHVQFDNYQIYDLVCVDTKSTFYSTYNNQGTKYLPESFHNDFVAIQAYSPTPIPFNFVNEFVMKYQ